MSASQKLIRLATEQHSDRYPGEPDTNVCAKVPTSLLRDLDASARYSRISRAELVRIILADALGSLVDELSQAEPNKDGLSWIQCMPTYVEDLPHSFQAEIRDRFGED